MIIIIKLVKKKSFLYNVDIFSIINKKKIRELK